MAVNAMKPVGAAAPQEIERLRGELDVLKNDIKELTETQHQAAHTIAAMKAAEEDLRRHVPRQGREGQEQTAR